MTTINHLIPPHIVVISNKRCVCKLLWLPNIKGYYGLLHSELNWKSLNELIPILWKITGSIDDKHWYWLNKSLWGQHNCLKVSFLTTSEWFKRNSFWILTFLLPAWWYKLCVWLFRLGFVVLSIIICLLSMGISRL